MKALWTSGWQGNQLWRRERVVIVGVPENVVELFKLDVNERGRSDSEGRFLDWFKPIAARVVAKVGF